MAILDTQAELLEQGPESGHFFCPETEAPIETGLASGVDIPQVSKLFWFEHLDLLGENGLEPGVILQYRKTSDGIPVSYDNENGLPGVSTLLFQANGIKDCGITDCEWQLTVAHPEGRTVHHLIVSADTTSLTTAHYDRQGREQGHQVDDGTHEDLVMSEIMLALSSDLLTERTSQLREQRQRVEENIALFAVEGIRQYAPKKFDKLLKDKEKARNSTRFTPLNF